MRLILLQFLIYRQNNQRLNGWIELKEEKVEEKRRVENQAVENKSPPTTHESTTPIKKKRVNKEDRK